jgi:hypothetical protein
MRDGRERFQVVFHTGISWRVSLIFVAEKPGSSGLEGLETWRFDRTMWHTMAAACEGTRWTPSVPYEDYPFGVAYWVITWH